MRLALAITLLGLLTVNSISAHAPRVVLPPQPLVGSFNFGPGDGDPIDFNLVKTATYGGSIHCSATALGPWPMTLTLLNGSQEVAEGSSLGYSITVSTKEALNRVFWDFGGNPNAALSCNWMFFDHAVFLPLISK